MCSGVCAQAAVGQGQCQQGKVVLLLEARQGQGLVAGDAGRAGGCRFCWWCRFCQGCRFCWDADFARDAGFFRDAGSAGGAGFAGAGQWLWLSMQPILVHADELPVALLFKELDKQSGTRRRPWCVFEWSLSALWDIPIVQLFYCFYKGPEPLHPTVSPFRRNDR